MKHLAIRVDTPDASYDALVLAALLEKLAVFGTVTRCIYAHEIAVKTEKPHFHAHITLDTTESSKKWPKGISSYLARRVIADDPDQLTWLGSQHANKTLKFTYAEKHLKTTEDYDRWQRYPLKDIKQYSDISMIHQIGYSGEDLKLMWTAARTEREQSLKTFQKHENKLNNDKQERQKMWDWLDEQLPDLHCRETVHNTAGNITVYDPMDLVSEQIVVYNIKYNNYKIPMDLKRRTIQYVAYRQVLRPDQIAAMLMR